MLSTKTVVLLVVLVFNLVVLATESLGTVITDCRVVIVGGSTSALAAALSSASEGVKTCLLEPTDWIGGQMTTSGVPAIDFAWKVLKQGNRTFDVPKYDKDMANVTPNLYSILHTDFGHTGRCWVSDFCYLPELMLNKGLVPLYNKVKKNLILYLNTVIKRVKREGVYITEVHAIQRTMKPGQEKNCLLLSQELPDWYNESESDRFQKERIVFKSENSSMVVMDATDWGEVLALSKADYLQGIAERYDGDTSGIGNDQCGQSIVYGFSQKINDIPTSEPANPYPVHHPNFYSNLTYSWDQVWTYRRLLNPAGSSTANKGDITLQNWGKGNDYEYGYLFLSRSETKKMVELDRWNGGVNLSVLNEAEYLAYGWHYWFKNASKTFKDYITMDKKVFGTCHGLSKLPYIRDTRRSIGVGDFVIKITDLTGNFTENLTGKIPFDHVAIGSYSVDIHSLYGCKYPSYMDTEKYDSLPFFIPYRAMTNRAVNNLLVTGKVMAQSFLANAATRLHPIEWSSGTATGVAAAYMIKNKLIDTSSIISRINDLQSQIEKYTPIRWTIDGKLYPPLYSLQK